MEDYYVRPPKPPHLLPIGMILFALGAAIFLLALCGCSFNGNRLARAQKRTDTNFASITEQSRALTTAALDVLSVAPTNQHTVIALDLVRHDQQLEGLPITRIDAASLLAGQSNAWADLQARYRYQQQIVTERAAIEAKLAETTARLVDMGKLYEEEKNRGILKRIWRWSVSTLGLGGLIALCVFCPAVIPIVARFFGWLVSKVPQLAGALGVVSKNTFDNVVRGVGKIREGLKEDGNTGTLQVVNTELHKATDIADRRLIDLRRLALNV